VKCVLVTGAAGFLGSHLCDKLLAHGYKVIGVDNFFRGKIENLPEHDNFYFYACDVSKDLHTLKDIMTTHLPEIVFHYAAINGTQYFYDIPYKVFDDNVAMTQTILAACDHPNSRVKKILYASSSEVYGNNPPTPTPEEHHILLNVYSDRDSYASSKALGDFYVKHFCKQKNISYVILRIFNTYGPRMDVTKYGQVVPEFIRKAHSQERFTIIGTGKHTRSFCFVEDHVEAVVRLIDMSDNEIINIGNDEEVTIEYLAKTINQILNKEYNPAYLPERDYDTLKRQPDINKLKKYIGEHKFVGLNEGLYETIAWYIQEKK